FQRSFSQHHLGAQDHALVLAVEPDVVLGRDTHQAFSFRRGAHRLALLALWNRRVLLHLVDLVGRGKRRSGNRLAAGRPFPLAPRAHLRIAGRLLGLVARWTALAAAGRGWAGTVLGLHVRHVLLLW